MRKPIGFLEEKGILAKLELEYSSHAGSDREMFILKLGIASERTIRSLRV